MIGTIAREPAGRTDHAQRARPQPALRPDHPDQREHKPQQREQQVGERAQEDQQQGHDQKQRQPDQRRHPLLRRLLILILSHHRRHTAHAQRALIPHRQFVDPPFSGLNSLVPGVVQADRGDCDRRAVRVASGHRRECPSDLRGAAGGVDVRLRERPEVVRLERGLDQRGGRDDRITRGEQRRHVRVTGDCVEQGVHLGQPAGCERFAAEQDRDDTDLAGFPEEIIDLFDRIGDGAPGRKEVLGLHGMPPAARLPRPARP